MGNIVLDQRHPNWDRLIDYLTDLNNNWGPGPKLTREQIEAEMLDLRPWERWEMYGIWKDDQEEQRAFARSPRRR
jgi:hypothetical protein